MTRHFTSDLHFGHANIIEYCSRPHASVEEMNEAMVDGWNAVVKPEDEVWILGDLCLGKLPDTLSYIERLVGHKVLLPGNHDACWVGHKGWRTWASRYVLAGIDEVIDKNQILITVAGWRVLACHFPYFGDHVGERYHEYRPIDRGLSLLHGHVHDKWKVHNRQINVGVDVWEFHPVSEDELVPYLRA